MSLSRRSFLAAAVAAPIAAPSIAAAVAEPAPALAGTTHRWDAMWGNSILDDVPYVAAPSGGNRIVIRAGLPSATWRKFNGSLA